MKRVKKPRGYKLVMVQGQVVDVQIKGSPRQSNGLNDREGPKTLEEGLDVLAERLARSTDTNGGLCHDARRRCGPSTLWPTEKRFFAGFRLSRTRIVVTGLKGPIARSLRRAPTAR